MHTADVEYAYGDRQLIGELSVDDRRPGPATGCAGLPRGRRAQRPLAEQGPPAGRPRYVAFALDYHGGGKPLP